MRNTIFLFFFSLLLTSNTLQAQCEYPIDTIDRFDSTRLIVFEPITIGYMVPNQVLTEEGPGLVEEAKVLFIYTENDSINSFFFTFATAEREYYSIETGRTVWIMLSNEQIVELYNVPDRGSFDSKTNMRIYQHTCVVPIDLFYNLTHHTIQMIRINYNGYKKTIKLLPDQQERIREAVRCIGETVKLFPIKP